jgi:hypothetical protein
MWKQVLLLKRRPGMSLEEFIDYYENHHSKLVEPYMQTARRYVRRYVTPQKNPMTGEVIELDFDVITEIWWDSRDDLKAVGKQLAASGILSVIHEDEKKLFDSHDNRTSTVEEHDTALPRGIVSTTG